MPNAQARISAAVLASGTLHLLVTLGHEPVRLGQGLQSPSRQVENQMTFEVLAAAPAAPERVPAPSSASMLKPRSRTARAQRVAVPARVGASANEDARASEPALPNVVAGSRAAASTPAAQALDLSPGAAARTLTISSRASWSVPQPDNSDREVDRAAEARLARAIPELSRSGDDQVGQLVEELTWFAARPWEFILKPLRGARYHFRGAGFDAIIQADGSVQYRDKNGLNLTFSQVTKGDNQNPGTSGRPATVLGLGFHGALVPTLFGYDAHRSERRTFLARTRALRELLHDRAQRVALARAALHLDQSLARIALKLEAGDDRAARAQLFALWDECAEDEVGAAARRRIETFAREQCREGSALTFAPAELTALNERRVSRELFDPYRALADAGVSEVRIAADD